MEAKQKLEIADRIRELRERAPRLTQPLIAEKLGIGLRAYQKLEAEGTTRYERCEEIAAIHESWAAKDPEWSHVSASWLWDGKERPDDTDLLGKLSEKQGSAQLSALRGEVAELGDQIAALEATLLAELAQLRSAQEDSQSKRPSAGRSRGAGEK